MELPRLQRLRVIVEKIESKNMLSEHSCLLLILDYLKCALLPYILNTSSSRIPTSRTSSGL